MTTGAAAPVLGGLVALAAVTMTGVKMTGGADQVARVAAIGAPPADRAGDQLAVRTDLLVVLVPPGPAGQVITVRLHSPGIGAPAMDPPEKDRADTIILEWRAGVTTVGEATLAGEAITDRGGSHSTAVTIMVITAGPRTTITGTISLIAATIAAVGNMSAMPSTATASAVTGGAVITAGTTRVAMAGDRRTLPATMVRMNWRGWLKTCVMKSPSFIVKSIVCAKSGVPVLETPGGGRVAFRAVPAASAVRGGGLGSGCVTVGAKERIEADRLRTGDRTERGMIDAGLKVVLATGAVPMAPGSIDAVPGGRRATAGDLRVGRRMIVPGRIAAPMIADRMIAVPRARPRSGAPTTGRNGPV